MFINLSNKFLRWFIAVVILGAAVCFALNMIMTALIHSKKEIKTPDIVGKSLYDALEELSSKGFGLKKEGEEINEGIPAGIILRQNPPAGMIVRVGKIIKITISQGGKIVYVPDLVGQTIRSADIALRYSTLVMGEVLKKFSIVMEKGVIISQDIAAGTKVDKDSVVNVVVSDGFPPEGMILMPDFINKNVEEAKIWASRYDIIVNIKSEEVLNVNPNTVIRQYPQPDDDVTDAKIINLSIASRDAVLE
ncbi:MAG: PASTA domain-containing protein [Endomicrobium sp.]|jgi:serine/threonine-protein kinase|nr:PASTA domain-containing protein [Endomicrobium sp.]